MRSTVLHALSPAGDTLCQVSLTSVQIADAGETTPASAPRSTQGMAELAQRVREALSAQGLEPIEDRIGLLIELGSQLLHDPQLEDADLILRVRAQTSGHLGIWKGDGSLELDDSFLDDLFRLPLADGDEVDNG